MHYALVTVVCGPPCSGKTTFTKNLKTKIEKLQDTGRLTDQKNVQDEIRKDITSKTKEFQNVVLLSYDDLMPFEINNSIIKQKILADSGEEDHSSYCYAEDSDEHIILVKKNVSCILK